MIMTLVDIKFEGKIVDINLSIKIRRTSTMPIMFIRFAVKKEAQKGSVKPEWSRNKGKLD